MALAGRTAAVFGVAGERSIAWAIATELQRQGASVAVGIQGERFQDRVAKLIEERWSAPAAAVIPCDVTDDAQVEDAGQMMQQAFPGGLDTLVHSIAFATAHGMRSRFVECTREDFRVAHDVSAYSLVALARAAHPGLIRAAARASRGEGPAPSVLALSYLGSTRTVPSYSVMGPAKASLEASVRALAADLGPEGVRVNCVSPGTVNTAAARGIPGFTDLHAAASAAVPGPRVPDGADAARVVAFLASDAAAGVHGQTVYVDGGVSSLAFPGLDR